ncbi:NHL repeat domain protein [hydrothermal vent metagenome]|uniref:NHL repeat domain protein n=1 Tax=hydrothermal vent metagenome TaxID=652676 RepID=A0A3B0TSV6_9ZZZZ
MNFRLFLLTIFMVSGAYLFYSCSTVKTASTSKKALVIYPSPPDTARIQYLTSFSSSLDFSTKQSKFNKSVFGEDKPKVISKPFGIETHKGKLYICDIDVGGLEVIDFEKNSFDYFIPGGKGELKLPLNCFIDEDDFLYVADGNRRQIVIFNAEREYVSAFGQEGDYKPTDVFVYDNKIWVTNIRNNKIDVYEKAPPNKLLYSFPDLGEGEEGALFQPTNIFINDNKVYVTDFGDFKIKKYTHKGEYLSSVGSYGRNIGQFVRPKGIAVDRDSNLYVVDTGFENTQIFNEAGQLLMFFGGTYQGPGGMYLPAGIAIDYDDLNYFQKYVDSDYLLKYLIFITNQYGPDKVSVYGAIELK